MDSIFKEYSIDYVIHTAAIRGAGKAAYIEYQSVNVYATKILLEFACRYNVNRFLYCSSVGVWGTIPKIVPPDDRTEYIDDNFYHKSKIEAEKIVYKYCREKELDAVIVRPTISYGRGDNGFPAMFLKLVKKRMFVMPRREVFIHLVSVEKVAELFVALITKNKLYQNLFLSLDKRPLSLKNLADEIYNYYYGKTYPKYLSFPDFFFIFATALCRLIKNDKWTTRLRLISNNWYYAPIGPEKDLSFQQAETEVAFKMYLKSQ